MHSIGFLVESISFTTKSAKLFRLLRDRQKLDIKPIQDCDVRSLIGTSFVLGINKLALFSYVFKTLDKVYSSLNLTSHQFHQPIHFIVNLIDYHLIFQARRQRKIFTITHIHFLFSPSFHIEAILQDKFWSIANIRPFTHFQQRL